MARYLRRNQNLSIDIAALALRGSPTAGSRDHMPRTDIRSAHLMIASDSVTFLIALGPYTRCVSALGFLLLVVRGCRKMGATFLVASDAMALALIGAASWSFDRIIRDRRTSDRSECP